MSVGTKMGTVPWGEMRESSAEVGSAKGLFPDISVSASLKNRSHQDRIGTTVPADQGAPWQLYMNGCTASRGLLFSPSLNLRLLPFVTICSGQTSALGRQQHRQQIRR